MSGRIYIQKWKGLTGEKDREVPLSSSLKSLLTFIKLFWTSSFCFFKELVFIIYYKKQEQFNSQPSIVTWPTLVIRDVNPENDQQLQCNFSLRCQRKRNDHHLKKLLAFKQILLVITEGNIREKVRRICILNLRGKGLRVLPCSSIQQALVPTFSAFPVPKKSKRLSRIKLAMHDQTYR